MMYEHMWVCIRIYVYMFPSSLHCNDTRGTMSTLSTQILVPKYYCPIRKNNSDSLENYLITKLKQGKQKVNLEHLKELLEKKDTGNNDKDPMAKAGKI